MARGSRWNKKMIPRVFKQPHSLSKEGVVDDTSHSRLNSELDAVSKMSL